MDWKTSLDPETATNIARALWQFSPEAVKFPAGITERIGGQKNSPQAFGRRMATRLEDLLLHPETFTPSYRRRYQTFLSHCQSLSAHQAYAMTMLLGMDSARGYTELVRDPQFEFPRDHAPQLGYQVGWHFFVGSCWDERGQEYGVQYMLWTYSLLPPPLARKLGLSDLENQMMELHLAISVAGGRHYRAAPVLIAGTTGLVDFDSEPFTYVLGNNRIQSQQAGALFPLRLLGKAWDCSGTQPVELSADLMMASAKPPFLQGRKGATPSIGGVGTLYYSQPHLKLDPTQSTISIDGQTIPLSAGKFWFDHQWATGFGPSGNARDEGIRAAACLAGGGPGGWDWFMAQFFDDQELTVAAPHTNENRAFYAQTGPQPPGKMTSAVIGKWVSREGIAAPAYGTLTVPKWVKAERSPDPAVYPITHTWYPDRWEFRMDGKLPEPMRQFAMHPIVSGGQAGYFATGAQYSEGAVVLEDADGQDIGRGFAESVSYADATGATLTLAGLPDTPATRELLKPPTPSWWLKLRILLFLRKPSTRKALQTWAGTEPDKL
jgi:predicted secreted hydrolase